MKHQKIWLVALIAGPVLHGASPVLADAAMECSIQKSTQVEVSACVEQQLIVVDRALVQALGFAREAAAELDSLTGRDVAVPSLDVAQKNWLAYRDAQCDYIAASFAGGSGAGIAEGSCLITLTRERTTQLMSMDFSRFRIAMQR